MKLLKTTILPYPVLGVDGDYKCDLPEFHQKISPESNDNEHIISCTISISKPKSIASLLQHITNGNAVLSFEIDCLHTLNRHSVIIDADQCSALQQNGELTVDIKLNKICFAKEVSITPFITATNSFNLEGDCFNEMYGHNPSFYIEKGDVLAALPTAIFNISLNWKHLYSNAGAPMRIEENTARNAVIETVLGSDIVVKLPTKEYKNFKINLESDASAAPIILMSLARPAVMTALEHLSRNPGANSNWAMALKNRIDNDNEFGEFRPENGDWEGADLTSWVGQIEKIASLIFKGTEEKMFNNLKNFVKQHQE